MAMHLTNVYNFNVRHPCWYVHAKDHFIRINSTVTTNMFVGLSGLFELIVCILMVSRVRQVVSSRELVWNQFLLNKEDGNIQVSFSDCMLHC
jgi:hypothetical protein